MLLLCSFLHYRPGQQGGEVDGLNFILFQRFQPAFQLHQAAGALGGHDIGTGTGVLAIAARKLGNNRPILAFDNNSWAAENAIENIAENHADDIKVELLDAEEDLIVNLKEGYDLILANINKNVIDRILPVIRKYAPAAPVLLSGILVYDEPWLNKLLKRLGYTAVQTIYEDEWLSSFIKPV